MMRSIHGRATTLRGGFTLLPANACNVRRGKNIHDVSVILDYDSLQSDKNVIRMGHGKVRTAGQLNPKRLEWHPAHCFSNLLKHVLT
jgi:hypothetical protein